MKRFRNQRTIFAKHNVVGKRAIKSVSKRGLPGSIKRQLKVDPESSICIIRSVGGLGDVLMCTPALREIKRRYPNSQLTFAIQREGIGDDGYYEILKNAPFIDKLIDARLVDRSKYTATADISAVCFPYEKKGLPDRNRIDLFASHLGISSMENYLPYYAVEPEEFQVANSIIKNNMKSKDTKIVSLHIASFDEKRNWPVDNYVKLINFLNKKDDYLFLIFDFNRARSTWSDLPNTYDASNTSMREMAALIEQSDLFIGPDSGPMHMAGALSVKSLVLFGSIPPGARINRYPSHRAYTADIPCLGCWYKACPYEVKCMKMIEHINIGNIAIDMLKSPKNKIVFESILNAADGYGSSAEQMVLALDNIEPSIRYKGIEVLENWEKYADQRTIEIVNKNNFHGKKYIGYYSVQDRVYMQSEAVHSRYRYIYTTFESTQPPVNWKRHINAYDKLFVSCSTLKKAFNDIGVNIPISIIPLGVNESLWPYRERNLNRPFRFFVFANADWSDNRKNYYAAYKAFVAAFGSSPEVELWLKTTPGKVPSSVLKHKNVKLFQGRYTQEEIRDLLYKVDCFVTPTKGEGYGLPAREAMCTGIPVIAASFCGMESIMEESFNYKIKYSLEKARFNVDSYIQANNGLNDFGYWANPSIESLSAMMKKAYRNRSNCLERGFEASEWVRRNETYTHTANLILSEI